MKIIITGATGMVGSGVLLECLDHPAISKILLATRKPVGIQHEKVKELIIENFNQLTENESQQLQGYDACFFCLGISSVGKSEEEFTVTTKDLTLHFAEQFLKYSPNSVFTYVSGAGTNAESKTMWSRVKGTTENELLAMDFKKAYMFRPGYIQPMKGIQSKTSWYMLLYKIFWPIYSVLRLFPSAATNSINVGLAMINVTLQLPEIKAFENKDINFYASAK